MFIRLVAVALAMLAMVTSAWAAPPTPTTLEIDCGNGFQATPFNCNFLSKPRPDFRFNGTTGCNRYQIQADKVSTFPGAPWFWDSGTQTATCTSTTTAAFPASTNGGSSGQGSDDLPNDGIAAQLFWHGQRRFYWRVRVSDDGGSTWSAYSTASAGGFSGNTYPMMPEPLSVANGSGGGAFDAVGDVSAGATLHAAVSDTGAGNCTTAGNACDLAQAVAAAVAGDTIAMATGSYAAPNLSSAAAGTVYKPITLTKESGATPSITSSTLTLSKSFWTVNGLTFTQSSGALIDYSAANLVVKNCTFTGTGQSTVAGEGTSIIFGGNHSNYFLNNVVTIAATTYNIILPQAGANRTIRGNDISSNGSRAIKKAGDETTNGGNMLITDNYIHDLTGSDGGVPLSFYYASGHVYMARNYIRGGSNAGGYLVQFVRGVWPQLRNNTFQAEGDSQRYCAQFNQNDGKPIIENLACISTSIAFAMLSPDAWNTTQKIQLRNSAIRRNGGGTVDRTDNTGSCASDGTTCFDFTSVQWSTASLAFDGSGRPTSSSTVTINGGVAGQAIPTGAASPIDIGRFEYQATTGTATSSPNGVYDYQSQWTVNTTPRISWTFNDGDNALMSAGQTQSAYEVQIDTSTYFNTYGEWKPYCSSGIVASSSAFWDVPSGCSLAPSTKYYFRVRTWDNAATVTSGNAGTWSDYVNAFTTSAGASYYVSTTGSDSAAGTLGAPFATWPKAISVAVAGDTVYGRAGTHTVPYFRIEPSAGSVCGPSANLSCGANGTSGSPITYTNYNGENVILNTTNSSNPHGQGVGIDNHGNYIVFRGLKVTGAPEEGLDNRGDNVIVDQCEFYNNSTEESQNNVQVEDGADNFTMTRSKLYWTSSFVSSVSECTGAVTEDRYCTSHNLYLQGNNHVVMNNFIYDTLGDGRAVSVGASNAYGVQIGSTGLSYSGTVFAYNTIANTATRAGLVLYAGGGALTNVDVYNNIIRDANSTSNSGTGSIYVVNGSGTNEVVNNIFDLSASPSGIVIGSGTSPASSGNLTTGADFVNYATRDLHINGTSPAIGAASSTVTVATDFDGDTRPIGGTYDIGADETAASSPGTPGRVSGVRSKGSRTK